MTISCSRNITTIGYSILLIIKESRFLNFAVKNWKVDTSKWTPSEKELFQEGVEVLSQFDALENFVTGVGNMKNEALTIYQEISRDISTPTILGRDMKSSQQVIEELSNFLHRYKELLDQIEDADWKRKVLPNLLILG